MAVRSRRTMTAALVLAAALVLTACAKATFTPSPWGAPLDALKAAAEKIKAGVDYTGQIDGGSNPAAVHGTDIPGQEKLRIYRQSGREGTQDTIIIGQEMWLHYDAPGLPTDWGHFKDASFMMKSGGFVGPATILPAVIEQIKEVKWVDERTYEGTFDFDAIDDEDTGFSSTELKDVDDADEVEFKVLMNMDGTISTFSFELPGDDGDIKVGYSLNGYGAPKDVAAPNTADITELTVSNFLEWLFGQIEE